MTTFNQEKREEFILRNIPKRYWGAKKEDIPNALIDLLESTDRGLYFYGGSGVGKTHYIYAMIKTMNGREFDRAEKRQKEIDEKGEHCSSVPRELFQVENSTNMLLRIKNGFNDEKNDFYFEELLAEKRILFIDDIGAEKMSDWVRETFYLIINGRYEKMLKTHFTSNYDIKEIAEKVGDRIASRILEMCDIVELRGKDKRLEKIKKIVI